MSVKYSTLEAATEFVLDGTHGSPKRTDDGVPVLSAQNVVGGELLFETSRFTTDEEYQAFARRLKPIQGDVLLTIVGTIGRAAVLAKTPPPLVFQRSVSVIRPRSETLDSRFLYYAIQSDDFQRQLDRATNKSSQAGVYLKKLKQTSIPLPPLAEQKRIAAILDAADNLRHKRRQALAQLDTLLQSTFLDMFSDPVTNPMGWDNLPLSTLAISKPNNGIFRKNPEYSSDRNVGTPVVWVEELFRGNRIDTTHSRYLEATEGEVEKYGLRYGDILFCRSSLKLDGIAFNNVFLGKSNEALFECHLIRVSPNAELVDPIFLNIQLRSTPMRAVLKSKSKTATMTTIDQQALLSVEVILPPLNLQRRFAEIAESVESQKTRMRAHLAELDALFASLQSRAFNGEL